jgi:hypothetical protein
MTKLICELEIERETKGAVRYQQMRDGERWSTHQGAPIGSMYIRKTAFEGEAPKAITVIVEERGS